ncbi:MAG: hypothetical protein RIQ78_734 [Bacteroidota bacterium]|jgi:hypothetical protein
MSVRTLKSFTWLWIASLLIATVGVSGQQIYCYCVGETTMAFFSTEDPCSVGKKDDRGGCCAATSPKNEVRGCCSKASPSMPSQGCTRKTTLVFQLKTAFLVQDSAFEKMPDRFFDQLASLLPQPFFSVMVVQGSKIAFPSFDHPPPRSGRMICVRHGVFRC